MIKYKIRVGTPRNPSLHSRTSDPAAKVHPSFYLNHQFLDSLVFEFKMRLLSLFPIFLITTPSIAIPAWLIPRQCITEYPSYQGSINKEYPSSASSNGPAFVVWKNTNGTELQVLLQFTNIPTNSWGCQLELYFPKGYPSLYPMYSEQNILYVYKVNERIEAGASWNTAPKPAYLFGNTAVGLPTTQPVQNDIRMIVNSAQCAAAMGFRISIPPDIPRGGVQFWRNNPWENVGFRMTHNC